MYLTGLLVFSACALQGIAADTSSRPQPPAKSLKDIEHVVLFMLENRSFDSYFGTLAGVRGFKDPNVAVNPADVPLGLKNMFYQLRCSISFIFASYP
jgi:phospholipase C